MLVPVELAHFNVTVKGNMQSGGFLLSANCYGYVVTQAGIAFLNRCSDISGVTFAKTMRVLLILAYCPSDAQFKRCGSKKICAEDCGL